jgi:hypothetical protein
MIVDSRFYDWIYWTSLLQLQLIITVHTLNSFLIKNLPQNFFWFLVLSPASSLLWVRLDHSCLVRATADQFILAPSSLRLTTRIFFQLNTYDNRFRRISYVFIHDPVRTANRTPCLIFPLLFCVSVVTVIFLLLGKMFTYPLSRNRRLCFASLTPHFRLSGVMSQYGPEVWV